MRATNGSTRRENLTRMLHAMRVAPSIALSIAVLACSRDITRPASTPGEPQVATTVQVVDGPTTTFVVGDSASLRAKVLDQKGAAMDFAPIAWSTDDSAVVSVSSNGVVHGLEIGGARITAASGSAKGSLDIEVHGAGKGVAQVILAKDVDAGMQAHLSAILSIADSTPVSGAVKVVLPSLTDLAAILATNGQGQPLLAAVARSEDTVELGAASTAIVLCRTLLPASLVEVPDDTTLDGQILMDPGFQTLVNTIHTLAEQGETYATSPDAISNALSIVRDVLATLPNPSVESEVDATSLHRQLGKASSLSTERFSSYPDVSASATSGDVTLTNGSFLPFFVAIRQGASRQISGRSLCLLCAPPEIGSAGTLTYAAEADGPLPATISFGAQGRRLIEVQASLDLFTFILRLSGLYANAQNIPNSTLIDLLGSKVDFQAAAAQGSWSAALHVVLDGIVGAAPTILKSILPQLGLQSAVGTVLTDLVEPLNALDVSVWVTSRSFTYASAASYWSVAPETAQWCLIEGGLYRACVDSISVDPEVDTVLVGKKVLVSAQALDSASVAIIGVPIHWENDDHLLNLSESLGNSVSLSARDTGFATLTVNAGSKDATHTVVAIDTADIYNGKIDNGTVDNLITAQLELFQSGGILTGTFVEIDVQPSKCEPTVSNVSWSILGVARNSDGTVTISLDPNLFGSNEPDCPSQDFASRSLVLTPSPGGEMLSGQLISVGAAPPGVGPPGRVFSLPVSFQLSALSFRPAFF